ncbi:site-2 protease family protein [Paenibacillus assamensis]|uniref:site-2 protease family protein n=1 Tax=Paenibacillus assamensis TaxID=311244 RepID=UPI00049016D5|nr:site-2 protease family protein [Paenibacillus assamensis]
MDWSSFFRVPLDHLPFVVLVLLIAFAVHEFAHAYAAYKFGDPTAKMLGRVTLNPAKHIDILGLLLFVIVGFGWAKPVPVNRANFEKPRMMSIIVTAVGPLSNLLLAFFGMLIYYLLIFNLGLDLGTGNPRVGEALSIFFGYFLQFNIVMFVFNLIPLPPLDGYRIVEELAPLPVRRKLAQFEQWSVFIFLLIVFIPPLRAVTIEPLFSLVQPMMTGIMEFWLRFFV